MNKQQTMHIRYIGDRVCWTTTNGNFYIGYREELTDQEKTLCDNGGGELPLSFSIAVLAAPAL